MANKQNSKKVILWGSVIVLAGVAGFILYRRWKKKKGEVAPVIEDKGTPAPSPTPSPAPAPAPKPVANPFKNQSDTLLFQNWVLNTKGDKTILGKSGADGKWGKNTAAAWVKYGAEWNSPLKGYNPRINPWDKSIFRPQ